LALHRTKLVGPGAVAQFHAMNPPASFTFLPTRLIQVLLLGSLLLFASGCAAMSRAKVGIAGTNESERPIGR